MATIDRRAFVSLGAGGVAATLLPFGKARAALSGKAVRIGVLNDQSSVFSDGTGLGSVVSAKMAVEDFGGTVNGSRIEIVSADHLNKPDVGAAIARQWFDRDDVAAVVDIGNSAVALAVNEIAKERDKAVLPSGSGSLAFTNKACSANLVQWTFDTWGNGNALASAMIKKGAKSWFFIGADYTFGHDLADQTAAAVKERGGTVAGSVYHPLNTADFASFLLQAKSSGANVVAFANGGGDTVNCIKQSREFGLPQGGQQIVGLASTIADVHSLGLDTCQGLLITEATYWDLNAGSRAWSQRWSAQNKGRYPTEMQTGVYGVVNHYLKAVKAADSLSGREVVAKMKQIPIDDPLFGKGEIRADGRAIHNMYVFQVKTPAESKGSWDYFNLVETIPAGEAFRPLSQSECSLVR